MSKKTKQGCGTIYGSIAGVDEMIGNMYRHHQNPYKRYFTQTTEGDRLYFENLTQARRDIISNMNSRVQITESHIQDELSLRTVRIPSDSGITLRIRELIVMHTKQLHNQTPALKAKLHAAGNGAYADWIDAEDAHTQAYIDFYKSEGKINTLVASAKAYTKAFEAWRSSWK